MFSQKEKIQVIVYVDEGVSGPSLRRLWKSLHEELDPSYTIVRKNAASILHEDWEKTTAAFIMPGGMDVPYYNSLQKKGSSKIQEYVSSGGKYLGICAGAYFACDSIVFEKGQKYEVIAERFLKFYPGIAEGPALGLNQYSPDSESGALITPIILDGKSSVSYYNGGCFFVSPEAHPNVKVWGHYDGPDRHPAVVACEIGLGKAVLSGVHLEYPVEKIHDDARRCAFRFLLHKLDLQLTSFSS